MVFVLTTVLSASVCTRVQACPQPQPSPWGDKYKHFSAIDIICKFVGKLDQQLFRRDPNHRPWHYKVLKQSLIYIGGNQM